MKIYINGLEKISQTLETQLKLINANFIGTNGDLMGYYPNKLTISKDL